MEDRMMTRTGTVWDALVDATTRDGTGSGWLDVYVNLCELADVMLGRVFAGQGEYDGPAYRLMQEQIPYACMMAGHLEPIELEAELRKRYGIPLPSEGVSGFDPDRIERPSLALV